GRYSNARINSSAVGTGLAPAPSSATPTAASTPFASSPSYSGVGAPSTSAPSAYREYVTKDGDNLLIIAENELGSSARWTEIKRLNNLPSGATYFNVGTKLMLPTTKTSGN
ncbi:MAG: hypothetical protein II655_04205, partial [Thermoguttaceae bacterium]|nr:hypothetical protein [Thermoguttaceae bacterium]